MYRQYDNPAKIQEMLDEAKKEYVDAIERGVDLDDLIGLLEDIAELKERLNFAYQDEKFEEDESRLDEFYTDR